MSDSSNAVPDEATANRQIATMRNARAAASFNSYELSCLMYGGEKVVQQRRAAFERVERAIGTYDTSVLPRSYGNMNREQAFDEGLQNGKVAFEDGVHHKHSFFDTITPRCALSNSSPFGMTKSMFVPTLRLQATSDQQARWVPLAESGEINGAYCQTELGHGTFVRGIETTATLDLRTDEFVIHSPTLSSTKFWPGSIGFSCTHAIVVARLIIRSTDYGVHLFMVQFRSARDGSPTTGIELGDLGLKMSYNGTDNGFATFKNVRIPRTDMLMGNSSVSKDGAYTTSPQSKQPYAILIYARTVIIRNVGFQLAQALTIATRYSTVREQGRGPNGLAADETTLMSYKSQQFRILTLISKAYAIVFASWTCDKEYKMLRAQQWEDNHSALPFNHNLASGLKAWATQTAADGAEDARKCCGGQGYLMISGLPEIVAAVTATCTFEGENIVLWQQLGRYLFKCVDQLRENTIIDFQMQYLVEGLDYFTSKESGKLVVMENRLPCQASDSDFLDAEVQLSIYRHRSVRLILSAHADLRSSKKPPMEAWNEHMMSIITAARAHIEYVVLQSFVTHTESLPGTASPEIKTVLSRLRSLFALATIINPSSANAVSFVEDGHLSLSQLNTIRSLVNDLLAQLVPDSIAVTDAWDFTDASLCSAIGMKDGIAYETLMNWIRQVPINVNSLTKNNNVYKSGWKDWIEPMLKGKL